MTDKNPAGGATTLVEFQKRVAAWDARLQELIKAEADSQIQKGLYGMPSETTSNHLGADGNPVRQQTPPRSVFQLLDKKIAKSEVRTSVFQILKKAETFINLKDPSNPDPEKSTTTLGKPANNLPGDRKPKKIEAEGAGGDMKKDEMNPTAGAVKPPKPSIGAAPKVAGIPSDKAGDAPTIPTPPAAPGMSGKTIKSEAGIFGKLKKSKK